VNGPERELSLDELPRPPLFKLVGAPGEDLFEETEVGGEASKVGALFSVRELAEQFSARAEEFGMGALDGAMAQELEDWDDLEIYALSGADYLLVISGDRVGLFHAEDVARYAAEKAQQEFPFPLYLISDEKGESPLISVEADGGEVSVTPLFSTPERARAFRERATHLNLPHRLGVIDDEDGLRRHALVARHAGADYAVIDPEAGTTEAIPIEELTS